MSARRVVVGVLSAVLLCTAMLPTVGFGGVASAEAGEVVAASGMMARTDGEWLVWVEGSGTAFEASARLWARRVDGGEPVLLTESLNARGWPSIDRGVVVWLENRPTRECPVCRAAIVGRDLASGREFVVANDVVLGALYQPSISGNLVVWATTDTVWMRDIASMSPAEIVATTNGESCYQRFAPVVSGDRVVWMECYEPEVPDPNAYPNYRILTKRFGEASATVAFDEPGNPTGFDLDGDRLIVAGTFLDITLIDVASSASRVIGQGRHPTLDGEVAIWEAPQAGQVDLKGFDLAANAAVDIDTSHTFNLRPDVANGVLIWQQPDADIFGADQPGLLRAARVSDVLIAPTFGTWITTIKSAGSGYATDGEWVIWTQPATDDLHGPSAIFGARLADRQFVSVATGPGSAGIIGIDDGVVVWRELTTWADGCAAHLCLRILSKDLRSGVVTKIDAAQGDVTLPIGGLVYRAGRLVYVEQHDGEWRLMLRDLVAGAEPVLLAVLPDELNDPSGVVHLSNLMFDGQRLVWSVNDGPAPPLVAGSSTVYTMLVSESSPVVVSVGVLVSDIAVSGDEVIYREAKTGAIVSWSATDGSVVALGESDASWLSADAQYVFWAQRGRGVVGVDLVNWSRFDAPGAPTWFALQDRTVVSDMVIGDDMREVHAFPLRQLLPTAPRAESPSNPNVTWHPETGHGVGWGFRDFWEANGGLPVFGHPLTDEFTQALNEGDGRPAQFFERQRFEWHAENVGTPYEVLLGRLGAELLVSQGRDWRDLPQADPSAPHYQPATGHAIDERFWAYWSGHGLDLGDAGVSFRESLALFGYPLTEPMLETNADGDTVLTQYFERAVFEWHPENPAEWQVLLRRLGAEEVAQRGW
ncbi:MAG: hypothetical protein M9890_03425 [Thermomicrobiales bacterium]|nr:hypothetical protein [Thermomicrobiales bacterium]